MTVPIPVFWVWRGAVLIAWASLIFGIFSAASPKRSIHLYQGWMALCNWQVSPRDETHEIRATRALGMVLILLGLGVLAMLFR